MFWANIQVLGPSIYSRPPSRLSCRGSRTASPFRAWRPNCWSAHDRRLRAGGHRPVMRLVRDDLTVWRAAAAWMRYEAKNTATTSAERVCIEHADRKDFLHDPARTWKEVDWVAKRSWLTKKEDAQAVRQDLGRRLQELRLRGAQGRRRRRRRRQAEGRVWEIWSKSLNKVVWVGEGAKSARQGKPHLTWKGSSRVPARLFHGAAPHAGSRARHGVLQGPA
jgi:hypothetical protein